jgi:hypothetical protein
MVYECGLVCLVLLNFQFSNVRLWTSVAGPDPGTGAFLPPGPGILIWDDFFFGYRTFFLFFYIFLRFIVMLSFLNWATLKTYRYL